MHPGAEHGMDIAKSVAETEIMDRLQSELDRYERIIGMSESILASVILPPIPNESPMARPEEAPYHSFHTMVLRLEGLNSRLEDLRSRVRL